MQSILDTRADRAGSIEGDDTGRFCRVDRLVGALELFEDIFARIGNDSWLLLALAQPLAQHGFGSAAHDDPSIGTHVLGKRKKTLTLGLRSKGRIDQNALPLF